jgi:hypothetical protein
MKIVAFSKNGAPGILVFVNTKGEEDAVLVNPGTPLNLSSVRSVVRHDPHIAYSVVENEGEAEGTQVFVKRRKEASNPSNPSPGESS